MLIYLCLYSDEVLFHANYFEIIRTRIQFEQGHQISKYRNLQFSLTEFMLLVGARITFFWVALLFILIKNEWCCTGCCIWLMVYTLHHNIFHSFSDGPNYTVLYLFTCLVHCKFRFKMYSLADPSGRKTALVAMRNSIYLIPLGFLAYDCEYMFSSTRNVLMNILS